MDDIAQKTPDYTPTGRWEVRSKYDSNSESFCPVLVDPMGYVHSVWSPDILGQGAARGYADTYNMNEDKADEWRTCPYCTTECSWCA